MLLNDKMPEQKPNKSRVLRNYTLPNKSRTVPGLGKIKVGKIARNGKMS